MRTSSSSSRRVNFHIHAMPGALKRLEVTYILQGKDACSTGYRKTAGWTLPAGKMLDLGIMPVVVDSQNTVNSDALSFSSFFGRVCAARWGRGPLLCVWWFMLSSFWEGMRCSTLPQPEHGLLVCS